MKQVVIASRESPLAMWQAEHVQAILRGRGHSVDLLGMTTKGDQILDRALSKVGGKGDVDLIAEQNRIGLGEPLGYSQKALAQKCDLCASVPEGPSCVRACPTNVLFVVEDETVQPAGTVAFQ